METDIAWAAGILDGEGCLYINRHRANPKNKTKTESFRLYLKITMGHRPTIAKLYDIFRVGSVLLHQPKSSKVSASHSWVVPTRQAEMVLDQMKPFVFTKLEELAIAEEFFALEKVLGGSGGSPVKTREAVRQRVRLYWRLRMAKSRWRFYKRGLSAKEQQEIRSLGL